MRTNPLRRRNQDVAGAIARNPSEADTKAADRECSSATTPRRRLYSRTELSAVLAVRVLVPRGAVLGTGNRSSRTKQENRPC